MLSMEFNVWKKVKYFILFPFHQLKENIERSVMFSKNILLLYQLALLEFRKRVTEGEGHVCNTPKGRSGCRSYGKTSVIFTV